MSKGATKVCFAFLSALLLFTLFYSTINRAQSLKNKAVQSESKIQGQLSENTFNVDVWLFLTKSYGFFSQGVHNDVLIDITMRLTEPPAIPYTISVEVFFPLTEVTDLPKGANYTYGFWGYKFIVGTLNIYMPANTSQSSIKIWGHVSGSSFLWRNSVQTPHLMNVTSTSSLRIPSYSLILVPPSDCRLLKVYSPSYPQLYYEEKIVNDHKSIVIPNWRARSSIIVLYEPPGWETYALILMAIMIFVFFIVLYAPKSRRIHVLLFKLYAKCNKKPLSEAKIILRELLDKIFKWNPSKFLKVYFLCAVLMVSLSFTVGPDPRLKVYVMGTLQTTRAISEFIHREVAHDAVVLNMRDEMSELKTLGNLGILSAVIVADFFPPSEAMVKRYILPGIGSVPTIIIIERYAFRIFSMEILNRYAAKTRVVENLPELRSVLHRIPRRSNVLRLVINPAMYIGFSAFVGLCSFILVFLGIAFLASKIIETGKKLDVRGFPEAIAYGFLIFLLTQAIYIVCSILLATPLGLHTAPSKVTAIGPLGFGGGSWPRMLSGLAGFLFGTLTSLGEGLKLDKTGLVIFAIVILFVLIDPLTSGIIFYEFVLLLTVGPIVEHAATTMSYTRTFLGSIAGNFGAWVSPIYESSIGIINYFAGVVLLCLFTKLKKSTSTILLLFCAILISRGAVRIADMRPWKSFASFIPGITAGLLLVAIFLLFDLVESLIRHKMRVGK